MPPIQSEESQRRGLFMATDLAGGELEEAKAMADSTRTKPKEAEAPLTLRLTSSG